MQISKCRDFFANLFFELRTICGIVFVKTKLTGSVFELIPSDIRTDMLMRLTFARAPQRKTRPNMATLLRGTISCE